MFPHARQTTTENITFVLRVGFQFLQRHVEEEKNRHNENPLKQTSVTHINIKQNEPENGYSLQNMLRLPYSSSSYISPSSAPIYRQG